MSNLCYLIAGTFCGAIRVHLVYGVLQVDSCDTRFLLDRPTKFDSSRSGIDIPSARLVYLFYVIHKNVLL